MFGGYRGWNLTADGMIAGRIHRRTEFTVLISGSWDDETNAVVYTPVERVHRSLPDREKFLSFDRLWEIYEKESAMPGDENFYEYALPEESLIEPLKTIGWEAYCATRGKGYTRIDIRMDNKTGKLFVLLEANAQCGIKRRWEFIRPLSHPALVWKNFQQARSWNITWCLDPLWKQEIKPIGRWKQCPCLNT